MANLLDEASILLTPTAYNNGSMLAVKPENGDGDFTFSRNSAATRVNAQGLVENVQILSGNLVSNGDFANGTTGWITTNGSITVTNSEATILGNSANGGVYQSIAQAGVTYFIEIEVLSINSGNWYAGGYITNTYSIDNTGKISFYYTSTGTGFHILSSGGAGSITIGNVSVKEITDDTNLPRINYEGFSYDANGDIIPNSGCGSWLMENQATNLITYSEDFSNAYYDENVSVTATNNSTISPSGVLNASKIQGSIDNAYIGIFQAYSTPSQTVTTSVFLKQDTISDVGLYYTGNLGDGANDNLQIDLSSGTLTSIGSSLTASIISLGNGWYKVISTYTTKSSGSTLGIRLYSLTSGSFYAWGIQLEQSSYPTSYIPTTQGASSTRLQDIATNSGSANLINSEEGVLYAEISFFDLYSTSSVISLCQDATNSNRILIGLDSIGRFQVFFNNTNGSFNLFEPTTLTEVKQLNKLALRWASNSLSLWLNGVKVQEDLTFISTNFVADRLLFSNSTGSVPFYGKTKALAVYKTALTDAQLTELTTI